MKEISKYLYDFLDSEFFVNHNPNAKYTQNKKKKKQNNPHFPSSHENMDSIVTHLIEDVISAHQEWNTIKHTIQEKITPNQIPKGTMYNVIPQEAKNRIESSRNSSRNYNFAINHQNIELNIVYVFSEDDPISKIAPQKMNDYFKECLYKVFIWLFVAYKQKHSECSQTLKIYLYLTDLFKIIPEKKENIIDEIHANTAFTTSCAPSTEIHIFREEEWFKVLIHESFHCLGFDFSHYPELANYAKTQMLEIFPVKSDVNLFETWCEMWGELFNIIIYVTLHYRGNPAHAYTPTPTPKILEEIKRALTYEQMFSLFQCVKVLQHQELQYEDICRGSQVASSYNENTNVLSYYVIKSILMFFIDDFFGFMKKSNQSSLVFVNSMENIRDYCLLIKKKYNNPHYISEIHKIEKWYESVVDYGIENITLRMTVLEW
jgi:hypothetical protein